MIVAYHLIEAFGLDKQNIIKHIALDQGVSCFFVLSGFILSYAYPQLKGPKETLRFFIARVARVWPAHIATALLSVCLLHLNIWQPIGKKIPWITLANLTMTHGWILTERSYFSFNAPSWSISTEFFFYLCFPLLIYNFAKTWKIKIMVAALFVLCCFGISVVVHTSLAHISLSEIYQRYLYINPLARVFEFVTGMAIFLLYVQLKGKEPSSKLLTVFEILIISAIILEVVFISAFMKHYFIHPYTHPYFYWLRYCGGVLFYAALILILALGKGLVARMLSNSFFVKLGDISYSVYLVHWSILSIFLLHKNDIFQNLLWLNTSCYCIAVLTAAYFNYTFIETVCRWKIVSLGEKLLCRIS